VARVERARGGRRREREREEGAGGREDMSAGRDGERKVSRARKGWKKREGSSERVLRDASAILFRETAPVSSALRGGFGPDWECAWGQRPQLGWLPPT